MILEHINLNCMYVSFLLLPVTWFRMPDVWHCPLVSFTRQLQLLNAFSVLSCWVIIGLLCMDIICVMFGLTNNIVKMRHYALKRNIKIIKKYLLNSVCAYNTHVQHTCLEV